VEPRHSLTTTMVNRPWIDERLHGPATDRSAPTFAGRITNKLMEEMFPCLRPLLVLRCAGSYMRPNCWDARIGP